MRLNGDHAEEAEFPVGFDILVDKCPLAILTWRIVFRMVGRGVKALAEKLVIGRRFCHHVSDHAFFLRHGLAVPPNFLPLIIFAWES
ncbi:hypothetical protein SH139x_002989 [Planctomycetaceae bacterium SH139]